MEEIYTNIVIDILNRAMDNSPAGWDPGALTSFALGLF